MPVVGGIRPLDEEDGRRRRLAIPLNYTGPTESEKPFDGSTRLPLRKDEWWKKRKNWRGQRAEGKEFRQVWRHPKGREDPGSLTKIGGRFAKRQKIGERMKKLSLTHKEIKEDYLDDDPR